VILHNDVTASYFSSGAISSDLLDVRPLMRSSTTYYLNGSVHDKEYSQLSVVEKLHDIHNYDRISDLPSVRWLNFSVPGYGDGSFLDLLVSNQAPIQRFKPV
jgi:hypothetical protein